MILGVSSSATEEELRDAYMQRRSLYINNRFAPGDDGAFACEKLDEIEEAYREALRIVQIRSGSPGADFGNDIYAHIEEKIKRGDIDEAQRDLDAILDRTAKWHFIQSMIYFKKKWYTDSLKQLETAIGFDPTNEKYRTAYDNLRARLGVKQADAEPNTSNSFYARTDEKRTYKNTSADNDAASTTCRCCSSLLCADCCCECCGGDLIRCC
jgi:molecular chaperone DnaJ